uniref:G-protein coupled receptors family 1 profile domain-containing protein n=1 Tax=Timema douglasi TaxID=61478 RepID=A0A7R8VCW3_TIMDO|nr:unnamed protein product [Timema douglasi]
MYILYDSVVSGADSDPSSDLIGNATSQLISALNSTDMTPSVTTETIEASNWGPKRDPLIVVVPITIIYALIFLLGIVGNVSTCIVIARNKHMHTATNYYLFSLAVSDMLLLVSGLPPEMYYHWSRDDIECNEVPHMMNPVCFVSRYPYVFGEAFCMIQGFAAETSANATVLTITAFTVERYVAICHPFQSHTVSKLSRAVRFIVGIWVLALCLAVPQVNTRLELFRWGGRRRKAMSTASVCDLFQAIQFGVVYERRPDGTILDEEHAVCAVKRIVIPHSFEISSFVFFLAPMTLITVLYVLIGLQLHRSSILARRDKGSVRLKNQVCRLEGSIRLKNQVHHKKGLHAAASSSPKNRPAGAMATSQTAGDATGHHPPPPPPPQPPHEEEEDGRKNFARNAQAKAAKHVVKMLVGKTSDDEEIKVRISIGYIERILLPLEVIRKGTIYASELGIRKVEFGTHVPTFVWRVKWKLKFSTPDRGSNPNLPLIGSLVQHESDSLDNATTKAGCDFLIGSTPLTIRILVETYVDAWRRPNPVIGMPLTIRILVATYGDAWRRPNPIIATPLTIRILVTTYGDAWRRPNPVIATPLTIRILVATYGGAWRRPNPVIATKLTIRILVATYGDAWRRPNPIIVTQLTIRILVATYGNAWRRPNPVIATKLTIRILVATCGDAWRRPNPVIAMPLTIRILVATYGDAWLAVVVTFFICWAPFHAQRLLAVYGGGDAERRPSPVMIIIYSILTYTSGILYYLSTTVNPVLYHIMSNKFREAFKDTLARYLGRRRGRGGRWKCYSVLSARSSRHSNNSSTCCHSNNSNASQRSSSGGGGGGGGKCLRYLEADMARLHESRRPVVVSFRRPASNTSLLTMETSTTTASSSEVYVSLEAALRNPRHAQRKSRILLNESYLGVICKHPKPSILKDMIRKDNLPDRKMFRFSTPSPSSSLSHDTSLGVTCEDNFTLLPYPKLNISEAPSIESVVTHVDVPLSGSGYVNEGIKINDPSSDPKPINFPKIEDIEIFQEQRLMIQSSLKRRRQLKYKLVKNGKDPSHATSCSNIDKDTAVVTRSNDASLSNHKLLNGRTSTAMTRSCTMPCVTSLEMELTPDKSLRRMDIINEDFEKKWSIDSGRGEVDVRPNGSRVDILPEELCERISNVVGHVDVRGYAMLMDDVDLSLEEKTSCNNLNNKAHNGAFLRNRDTSLNYPGLESTDDSINENPLHDTSSERRTGESQVGFHLKDLENCNNDLLSKRHKKLKSEEVGHPSRQTREVEGFHQKEPILFNDRVLVCYEAEPDDSESKVIRQSPASPDLQSYQIKCYIPKAINPRRPRSCFDLRDYLNYPTNMDRDGIYKKTINVSSPKLFACEFADNLS